MTSGGSGYFDVQLNSGASAEAANWAWRLAQRHGWERRTKRRTSSRRALTRVAALLLSESTVSGFSPRPIRAMLATEVALSPCAIASTPQKNGRGCVEDPGREYPSNRSGLLHAVVLVVNRHDQRARRRQGGGGDRHDDVLVGVVGDGEIVVAGRQRQA